MDCYYFLRVDASFLAAFFALFDGLYSRIAKIVRTFKGKYHPVYAEHAQESLWYYTISAEIATYDLLIAPGFRESFGSFRVSVVTTG